MTRELFEMSVVVACLFSAGYMFSTFLSGNRDARFRSVAFFSLSLFSLIPLSVPRFRGDGELVKFAELLNGKCFVGAAIYAYRCYPQVLTPYLHRTIGITGYSGELIFGIGQLSPASKMKRFPHLSEFQRQWQSTQPVVIVTTLDELRFLKSDRVFPGWIIRRGQHYVILVNRRMNKLYVWNHSFPKYPSFCPEH
ncbi:MAG: hypothetical protein GXO70_04815 [Acidobacteria bacterium]|nr:hypothetical protein [Acidobacteriota bacterium]